MIAGAPGTALVTGACGFVGSAVTRKLRADGWLVTALDIPARTRQSPVDVPTRARRASDGVCWGHDLTMPLPADVLAGVDLVIHAAALAGMRASWVKPRDYWRANVDATACECRRDAAAPRCVHARRHPVRCPRVLDLRVRARRAPRRGSSDEAGVPYGISKLVAERAWDGYDGVAIIRLSNVYGPGQRADMAYATFLRAALSGRRIELRDDGRQLRTPTYIDDCVAGIVAACAREAGGGTFNVAGPEDVRLREVPRLLGRLLGRAVPTSPAPPGTGRPKDGDRLERTCPARPRLPPLHHAPRGPRASTRGGRRCTSARWLHARAPDRGRR